MKIFNNDGEAPMSGRYDIIMSYFAEVVVQRLIKNVFPSPVVYRILLGAKDGPKDTGSIFTPFLGEIILRDRDTSVKNADF